jgi:hypothetical protein
MARPAYSAIMTRLTEYAPVAVSPYRYRRVYLGSSEEPGRPDHITNYTGPIPLRYICQTLLTMGRSQLVERGRSPDSQGSMKTVMSPHRKRVARVLSAHLVGSVPIDSSQLFKASREPSRAQVESCTMPSASNTTGRIYSFTPYVTPARASSWFSVHASRHGSAHARLSPVQDADMASLRHSTRRGSLPGQ